MELILETIKKMIGLEATYDAYDIDLLIQINSVFSILKQLGCFDEVVEITETSKWADLDIDQETLNLIRNYVYLKCRHYFDPPQVGSLMNALQSQIAEAEWRINAAVDFKEEV